FACSRQIFRKSLFDRHLTRLTGTAIFEGQSRPLVAIDAALLVPGGRPGRSDAVEGDAAMTLARRILTVSLVITSFWPAVAAAQVAKAGVVTTLEGNVTAARAATAQPVALKFKDDVFVNDRVVTGDRSLARLLLGGKAVVTVRERSALTITEVPGRSTVDLDSGKVAVAVAKDKMQPGEQVEVKTPNAVAAVRGTVFVAEVIRASASASNAQGGTTANFYVLTG